MQAGRAAVRRQGHGRERGASLVEFALVVPLLTLFLFGIVQFGIAYDKQQSINSAAREGARLGALPTSALDDIAQRAGAAADNAAVEGDPEIVVYDDQGSVHGAMCSDGNYRAAFDCPDPFGTPTTSDHPGSGDETRMPCGEDPDGTDGSDLTPSKFVRVVVSTPYDITIPFFGVQTVTIDSEAQFRCE